MSNIFTEMNKGFELFFNTHPRILEFKKQAKTLHKELKSKDVSLMQCQEIIAKKNGFNNWHQFTVIMKNTYQKQLDNNEFITTDNVINNNNFLLGYDINNKNYIWQTEQSMRTHIFLIAKDFNKTYDMFMATQSIVKNKGLLFLNPTEKELEKIIEIVKLNNRENDLKFINFSDKKLKYNYSLDLLLNELNHNAIVELFLGCMNSQYVEENHYVKSRMVCFLSSLLLLFNYLKENHGLIISTKTIGDYLDMNKLLRICNLNNNEIIKEEQELNVPENIKKAILSYFKSIPGFSSDEIIQKEIVMEQHGSLQMEIVKILNNLNKIESNKNKEKIKLTNFPNKNLKDIIIVFFEDLNEYDKWFYQNLVIFYFKFGLYDFLHSPIDVNNSDLNNKKDIKLFIIRDCYLPLGLGVMPSQARACGISMLFSYSQVYDLKYFKNKHEIDCLLANTTTQILCDVNKNLFHMDLSSWNYLTDIYKKSSKEDVEKIISNSNTKIFMKEEPKNYLWVLKSGNIYQVKNEIYDIINL